MNTIGDLNGKRVLLLQGPMGGFFKRLDLLLRRKGAITRKIGFNAGDRFFSHRDNYTAYREKREQWPAYITAFIREERIDIIYLFGDCRYYQREAIRAAAKAGAEVCVFEEGYIRPDYITMEKYGVNDYSRISRKRAFYDGLTLDELPEPSPKPAPANQTVMVLSAVTYYALSNLFAFRYPHYEHHRDFSAHREAFFGIRNLFRKFYYRRSEREFLPKIEGECSKKYFFVPLQTHNDFQILTHSQYRSIEKFIIEVLESFALYAPKETYLLFKHHPVDRGRKNYRGFIMQQAELLGVERRICVLHDVHLPMLLKNAIGTVTVNSTVGLSSLYHHTPTITLGNANYDIEGLTCKGMPLDAFWTHQKYPDMELFEKFRRYLIRTTQLNGSFYGKMPVI